MYNLIVDIGNTFIKYALMEGGALRDEYRSERFSAEELAAWIGGRRAARAIVCSTRGDASSVAAALEGFGIRTLLFTPETAVPLGNDYLTPETLGRDRLAAAVGADTLYPGRSVLIVDFGTAVTLDVVSGGRFRGGFISPGLRSRFRALHDYTAALPALGPSGETLPVGRSTREAMQQGVQLGLCYEIEGHIRRMRGEFDDLLVIFTGGDAEYFVKRIKNTIFADCDLVLTGLNRILEYHVHAEK